MGVWGAFQTHFLSIQSTVLSRNVTENCICHLSVWKHYHVLWTHLRNSGHVVCSQKSHVSVSFWEKTYFWFWHIKLGDKKQDSNLFVFQSWAPKQRWQGSKLFESSPNSAVLTSRLKMHHSDPVSQDKWSKLLREHKHMDLRICLHANVPF